MRATHHKMDTFEWRVRARISRHSYSALLIKRFVFRPGGYVNAEISFRFRISLISFLRVHSQNNYSLTRFERREEQRRTWEIVHRYSMFNQYWNLILNNYRDRVTAKYISRLVRKTWCNVSVREFIITVAGDLYVTRVCIINARCNMTANANNPRKAAAIIYTYTRMQRRGFRSRCALYRHSKTVVVPVKYTLVRGG